MKTLQEIFDFGLNHIRKQGVACVNELLKCRYRNAEGLSCIVGGFMTADNYDPEFDHGANTSVEDVAHVPGFAQAMRGAGADISDKETRELLGGMQSCHDNVPAGPVRGFLWGFNKNMENLAARKGLNYTPPA